MSTKIQQIKIVFNVTPEIERYVYMYLIIGENCYLIDSGVDGAEYEVEKYLADYGKSFSDIKAIFLTHSHPDHIGSAAKIKEKSGCKVYASQGEARWIENIDKQFEERPIPNFYSLVNKSVELDGILSDNDIIELEQGITINAIKTSGHSCDELSYVLIENNCIFVGDAIPVKGDIPIWINEKDSIRSLKLLKSMNNIDKFYPAWDKSYDKENGIKKINEALKLIDEIKDNVKEPLINSSKQIWREKFLFQESKNAGLVGA